MSLSSKKIVLGISGGIAAYKACDLVRRLKDQGAIVHVVMTRAACQFVTPMTFQALSGNPVHTELFDLEQESKINHIALADLADVIVVAPATADVIAKMAHGVCDDLLTTILCATRSRILLCPSMNVNMWMNSATQDNLALLKQREIDILDPKSGSLACGYEGIGRLPETEEIIQHLKGYFSSEIWADKKVLITAGPTWEAIDPVRHITSPSSGKTGYALAERCYQRGAQVQLVSGPTSLPDPSGIEVVRVRSADEMAQAVFKLFPESDIAICTAAVSDFRPKKSLSQKTKKNKMPLQLELTRNEDILARLGKEKKKGQILVGFAAETENVSQEAIRKLKDKNLDLICANDVSRSGLGFGSEMNQLTLFWGNGRSKELPVLPKAQLADAILDAIEDLLKKQNKISSLKFSRA
jgi:phosphopantothenoylcysteine decarboxylase/phosphopantothenate--cysteine ligase